MEKFIKIGGVEGDKLLQFAERKEAEAAKKEAEAIEREERNKERELRKLEIETENKRLEADAENKRLEADKEKQRLEAENKRIEAEKEKQRLEAVEAEKRRVYELEMKSLELSVATPGKNLGQTSRLELRSYPRLTRTRIRWMLILNDSRDLRRTTSGRKTSGLRVLAHC